MTLVNAETGEVLASMTPAEARTLTDTIKAAAETMWSLLRDSHDLGAWAALGYSSWREYAMTEFGISQSRAYQILDQAKVIAEIEAASSTTVEITEREARDLKPVLDEAKAAAEAAAASAETDEEKQERVRAALDGVREALVDQRRPKAPSADAKAIEDVVSSGSDVQVARLRKRFADALVRSGSAFTFDPDAVAPHLDEQGWQIVEHTADQSRQWFARLLAQKPKRLRSVKGGRG